MFRYSNAIPESLITFASLGIEAAAAPWWHAGASRRQAREQHTLDDFAVPGRGGHVWRQSFGQL